MSWVPDACTLPTVERPVRVAEFEELLAHAGTSARRPAPTRLALRVAGGEDVGAVIRDLVARETRCCTFFAFDVTRVDSGWEVDVRVPEAQVAVLDGLAQRAALR